jgi:hypothetical protein
MNTTKLKADVQRFATKLKNQAMENPLGAIIIATAAMHAGAKIMDANTQRRYAKVHEREVNRRIAMQSYKTR